MKCSELYARILVVAAVLGAVAVPFILWKRTPLIHARLAENGGWSPDVLKATVGEPLKLQITSDDVVHGFAVGQLDMQSVDILPGKVADIMLVFAKPGTYTFYCTRWCGLNHWRMRGKIEVTGDTAEAASVSAPPLYVRLGLDPDAAHESPVVPEVQPVAVSGQAAAVNLSGDPWRTRDYYLEHSPYQTWQELRGTPSLSRMSDAQIWDMVAFVWKTNTTPAGIANGKQIFSKNCAACHGEGGAGNGVFADELAAGAAASQIMGGQPSGTVKRPADFTDARRMLGASPALLQGKILRGGMGTGMPSWGPILSEDQTWDVIAYLYSLQFKYDVQGATP
jgi:mono/diheme cytochrome c family protein